jgi:aryl-alcohol dehydrogenase-like predicted oxidoreductase
MMGISLGFGGTTLTTLKSLRDSLQLLDLAYECGVRHFDTAPLYGQGYSEVIYGKFLKDKRQHITLTTKFGLGEGNETDKLPVNLVLPLNFLAKSLKSKLKKSNPEIHQTYSTQSGKRIDKPFIQKSLEKSLKRLQTEYLDYFLLHEGTPSFLTEDGLAYLLQLKKAGKVLHTGIGTNVFVTKTLTPNDVEAWDVLQYEYSNPPVANEVMAKFPHKVHFHHSCLQNIGDAKNQNVPTEDRGGFLLAEAARNNPKGKIIFSTRSQVSLKHNIEGFLKYASAA